MAAKCHLEYYKKFSDENIVRFFTQTDIFLILLNYLKPTFHSYSATSTTDFLINYL